MRHASLSLSRFFRIDLDQDFGGQGYAKSEVPHAPDERDRRRP